MESATVTCPACGTTRKAGRRFCGACGSPLPIICSACGAENEPDDRFCGSCGTSLPVAGRPAALAEAGAQVLQAAVPLPTTELSANSHTPAPPAEHAQASAPAPVEERRLVTALFCDLVGFTPLSESLDPEEVRDIQAEYFGAMSEQVARYGGTVEKYAGDAVLALFGAPVAHEDDAERAVLCALGMQEAITSVASRARERWDVETAIRVGVNTGEVISGTWDASGRQDVAVTGDALNTAARMQAAADPGEILVGAETMHLTGRRICYGDARDVTLKGKVGGVPVWPALGIREEFGERWEGYETPLVGRDREMVMLLDAWVRAQGGEGQLVTIVGEAGVGKSRLVAEFLGTLASSTEARIVRARSLSYGQEISLWLVADLLRSLFGIKEQETLDEAGNKLRAAIPGLIQQDEMWTEALDVLGEVLGLPIGESSVSRAGPQIRRHALIRSLRVVLGAVSERAPMVVVLEDLHWIDNASKDILTEVLADVLGSRILVLAAQRPGWSSPWNEWGWPERLTLRPLGEQEAVDLATAVLDGADLASELRQYVAERAGGNPFFVEEMLRSLRETGGLIEDAGQASLAPGAAERLPSTLTEVLLARLDRLNGETKHTAQVASVIGRSFGVQLLAEVVGQTPEQLEPSLAELQRAEIAFPRWNPDLEYVFKHVTMRDAVYNTLVQKRRQELHLQAARAIASLYPPDEYIEIIAYHYRETRAPEAGEWLERAGDRAAAVYANDEAVGHYEDALRRLGRQDAEKIVVARLEEKLGSVFYTAGRYDEALEHLGRAADIAREERDLDMAGRVTALMGMTHRQRGTPEEGIALVSPMVELLAWSGPSQSLASLHLSLEALYFLVGRYREQLSSTEKAAEIARLIEVDRLLGEALERRGVAMTMLGQIEGARRSLKEAIPLIEAGGDLFTLARALTNAGEAAKIAGEIEAARHYTERAVETGERVGNGNRVAFDLANVADVLLILGEWSCAREALERSLALVSDHRTTWATSPVLYLGKLALWSGDWEEAERRLDEALDIATPTGDRQNIEVALALRAELRILQGQPQEAVDLLRPLATEPDANLGSLLPPLAWALLEIGDTEAALETVRHAVEATWARPLYLVDALRVQGRVMTRLGRTPGAAMIFEDALGQARAMCYPYAEARILAEMGRWDQALAIFQRLGAKKDVERAEQALAASTPQAG